MAQTDRVIIHHEGGGKPRDEWDAIDAEDYSIEVGLTRIEVRNSPNASFETDGTDGPSLQIVLSGNRDDYAVTDNDLVLIDQACDYAASKNWIPPSTQARICQFHGDTAATACPGAHARARRQDIYDVVLGVAAPLPPSEVDEMWVLNERLPSFNDNKPGNLYVGLPVGFKSCRVDFYLDVPSPGGASVWAAQLYEGGTGAIGLWDGGKKWELWLPGKTRSYSSVALGPKDGIYALRFQNKTTTPVPVLVTVSGT